MLRRAVIFHHSRSESAAALARQLGREFERAGVASDVRDPWGNLEGLDLGAAGLIVCIGGDGTVLRAARLAIPHATPILGVNMGRLGFLTDMSPRDLFTNFERLLAEDWRLEERMMVRADVVDGEQSRTFHGLNDVVLSREHVGRPIYIDVRIDRARVAVYRCDAIIVATPTGSTGYSLAAGGPILAPTEHHLVLTPVSAHLALGRSIVLQPDSVVELHVTSEHAGILSVDGQEDLEVSNRGQVIVRPSEHVARFVRFSDPSSFYAELAEKLEGTLSSSMTSGV